MKPRPLAFQTLSPSILVDTSAWVRFGDPAVPASRRAEIERLIVEGQVAVCLPFLLEAGYTARNASEHEMLLERLLAMPRVWVTPAVEELALGAQAQLARSAQHRVPPADLLLAALADSHSLRLLHYDAHFDHIRRHSDLSFDSVWLSASGSL